MTEDEKAAEDMAAIAGQKGVFFEEPKEVYKHGVRAGMEHGRKGYIKAEKAIEELDKIISRLDEVDDLTHMDLEFILRDFKKKLLGLTDKGEG